MTEQAQAQSSGSTELTVQNTWITLLGITQDQKVSVSGRSNSLSGTWRIQRRINPDTNWNDVTDVTGVAITFTDKGAEITYEAEVGCDLRAGINTGDIASGGVFILLKKGGG